MSETRYLVFAGDTYYPLGGASDCRGVYGDATAAVLAMPSSSGCDWVHVAEVTSDGLVIVAERYGDNLILYPERMTHMQDRDPARRASQEAADR